MNIKELKNILEIMGNLSNKEDSKESEASFMQVGKSYSFRTITMIYTGKIVDMNDAEIVLEKAAWVAETSRWMEYVNSLSCQEVEPYKNKQVIIFRSSLLDVFEVKEDDLPLEQK